MCFMSSLASKLAKATFHSSTDISRVHRKLSTSKPPSYAGTRWDGLRQPGSATWYCKKPNKIKMASVIPKAKRRCYETKKNMESAGTWCLIESDPGVFTQLIHAFGARGVQVEELWSIDDDIFENLRPVHGLIFLFKYLEEEPPSGPVITSGDLLNKIYFARQTINNACATQAIISLLLNCEHPDLELGIELTKLKDFSRCFDPQTAGNAIGNSHVIRAAHNSMGHNYIVEVDKQSAGKDDEVYHFIGYMPIHGRLYELDGLRAGPIDHGAIPPNADWLNIVRPIIRARINKYTEGEIHFNLMALVSDRKTVLARQVHDLMGASALLGMDTDEVESEVARLSQLMDNEDQKLQRYEQELTRRRHNYLPFIVELMSVLAEDKRLSGILASARQRLKKRGPKRIKT